MIELFNALSFSDKAAFITLVFIAVYLLIGTVMVSIVLSRRGREEYNDDWKNFYNNEIKPQLYGVIIVFIWPYIAWLMYTNKE